MSLEERIRDMRIWYRFIQKKETVHTADASAASGIALHRITKNLVSITNTGEYVVLIIPGDRRVDLKKAADALLVKNVKLISFDEAESISGYPPGATPSIGFKTKMRVVLDCELTRFETLYCGGGSRDLLLEVRVDDVIRLNEAIVAPISS
ncbi:MAG: aminoacyl-tRNA deacylase [Candidatus Bathyarchaeia archaeon]